MSRGPALRSSVSRVSWRRGQSPASVQSRRRRRQVTLQPICPAGTSAQVTPLPAGTCPPCSTVISRAACVDRHRRRELAATETRFPVQGPSRTRPAVRGRSPASAVRSSAVHGRTVRPGLRVCCGARLWGHQAVSVLPVISGRVDGPLFGSSPSSAPRAAVRNPGRASFRRVCSPAIRSSIAMRPSSIESRSSTSASWADMDKPSVRSRCHTDHGVCRSNGSLDRVIAGTARHESRTWRYTGKILGSGRPRCYGRAL
ncbi:hypothetical protein JYK04_00213 [Streptomyces nojiriensis]|nr:hypothetical protein JYK04_00213 [Streptomyces nojiriensis]